MNKRKFLVYLPVILALVLAIGIIVGLQLAKLDLNYSLFGLKKQDKLREVINYVKHNYVDTVNQEFIEEKSITGLLRSLDPHSIYIPVSEFHAATDPLMGSFEGIGVEFRIERDTVTVINPVSGGPSEKIGIKAGDRIIKVDGKNVAGIKITNNEVMRKLKGPKGTKVQVSIFRRGTVGLIDFTITRDVIPTFSLDICYVPAPGTGYIRLSNFSASTHEELSKALKSLNSKGITKLILDLRGNGGGILKAAVDVADEFLPSGKLILYTSGVHHPKEYYYATGEGLFEKGNLVVLIDEWSASSSEIVAGAIQDNDRGIIIGRKSFGKGLVQEPLNFKDGSAVWLTVARYYTPTGRCIQRSYKNGIDNYYHESIARYQNDEPENPDSMQVADSLKFRTPNGKVVYGGGGIMPDIYVPVEKDSSLSFYNALVNKGLIYQFAFDYTDRHRKELSRSRTFGEFDRNFQISDKIYGEFLEYSLKGGVRRTGKDLAASDARIKVLIKAYVGRNILDNDGFYPFLNSIDPAFLKAAEVLQNF